MLEGVSGEIRGTLELDDQSGLIDRVECDSFCFRHDDSDAPAILDASQRTAAVLLVEQFLESEPDVASDQRPLVASARACSMPAVDSAGRRVLADLLTAASNRRGGGQRRRRAQ